MFKPLHIVMLHNRYQYAGGEDVSTDADVELLREYGHRVTLIETHNDLIKGYSQFDKLKLFVETAWNFKVYHQMRSQFQKLKPDLVHVQNFFPLFSPSVHAAARSLNIPTIQHLHNFRLGCLNGYLLKDGKICEACVGRNPWRGVGYGCYRDSPIASLAVWAMISFNRWRRTWWQDVDAFITPSHFAAKKLQEIGVSGDRLYVKPYVINPPNSTGDFSSSLIHPNFLFVGRLSPEKGVITLLKAWAELNKAEWQLNIVGDGSEKANLQRFVDEMSLRNVHFLGYLPPLQITSVMQSATAIVVPSQWYETFGRVVVEAFVCSKPVIASDLGALSELITSEYNGFLVPSDRINDWTEKLYWCGTNPEAMQIMGNNAYKTYKESYTRSANYHQLMKIYDSVLSIATK
ncbi:MULTISPECIES: glycosyltransferase family 4 protein [Pseudanabaena]|uniref:glycosyltransferase family 4 protein n=1 Tax=Pseudanabaena TaxID=1152 RepID=UPI0024789BEB|nr:MULTISPECIES: glycosyltransferase family 4 protein [Pseudanabaena]MEA5487692.1 glycosyltransferase family 4 protein [Pseudanabaena sp. CCNP1317]WGS70839.1 glycosyltransferase family 4 protein [Pseudanabaena galeata CCNP1313]